MSVKPVGSTPEIKESAPAALQATRTAPGIGQTPSSLECATSCFSSVISFFEWVASSLVYFWTWLTTDGPVMPEPTALEKEALAFADAELEKAGASTPFCGLYSMDASNPINRKVRQMMTLYKQARRDFENPLAHLTVEDEKIKDAAKRCLYLGYAIGYWTLKNLPADLEWEYETKEGKNSTFGIHTRSYALLLVHSATYQGFAILQVAQIYQRMKGHLVWDRDKCEFKYPDVVAPEYTARFYQQGTMENNFRELHNSLCQRAWLYLSREGLAEYPISNEPFLNWLQEDKPGSPFAIDPQMLKNAKMDPLGLFLKFGYMSVSEQFAYGMSTFDIPPSLVDKKT